MLQAAPPQPGFSEAPSRRRLQIPAGTDRCTAKRAAPLPAALQPLLDSKHMRSRRRGSCVSAVHHGTAPSSCRGTVVSRPAHDHAAGRCMPDSLETTLKPMLQPFRRGGGGGGKAKAVLSREMGDHFFKTDKSLSWCDQVFNRAARNGQFWHGDIVLTLVPTGVLHLCPSCHCTGPNKHCSNGSLINVCGCRLTVLAEHCSEQQSCHGVWASCTRSPPSVSLNVIVRPLLVPNWALKRG